MQNVVCISEWPSLADPQGPPKLERGHPRGKFYRLPPMRPTCRDLPQTATPGSYP